MAQKGLWKLARENVLQDRGEWSKEEGDVIREYKAMHEENFLSSWLREERNDREEWLKEVDKETDEETCKTRTREEERRENETVSAKRRSVGSFFFFAEAFEIFSVRERCRRVVVIPV